MRIMRDVNERKGDETNGCRTVPLRASADRKDRKDEGIQPEEAVDGDRAAEPGFRQGLMRFPKAFANDNSLSSRRQRPSGLPI